MDHLTTDPKLDSDFHANFCKLKYGGTKCNCGYSDGEEAAREVARQFPIPPLSTEQKVASTDLQRVVEALASGFRLVDHGDHRDFDGSDWYVEKCERFKLPVSLDIGRLMQLGVIEPHPTHAIGWQLTDKWHKAYMRSTDELRDGKLYVPE